MATDNSNMNTRPNDMNAFFDENATRLQSSLRPWPMAAPSRFVGRPR